MNLRRWLRWRSDGELREEIRTHLEHETQDLIDRGLPADEARRAALRSFGSPERVRELAREANPLYSWDTFSQDVRFGVRMLRRTPLMAATIVITLILGIGLNSSVFTILNAFLFRPLVSHDPDSFVTIMPTFSGTYSRQVHGSSFMLTLEEYEALRHNVRTLREVTASSPLRLTVAADEVADVRGAFVSCNFLSAHFDPPLLGRTFRPEDCAGGGNAVAVLNESLWRRLFDANPEILGRTITLNKQPFTVIGVAPNQLTLDVPQVSIWVPHNAPQLASPRNFFHEPGEHAWLDVQGRLEPGHTRQQAQAEISAIFAHLDEAHPGRRTTVLVTDGSRIEHPFFARRAPIVIGILMGSFTLILLVVCANVTMLLLSRAAARRQEMAIRLSLGAGRARLLRQLLIESLLLALVAAAGSWWVAHYLPGAMLALSADAPRELPLHPDWRVFAYTLAVALLAGCAAGLSPALESLRVDLMTTLRPLGSGGTGRRTSRVRRVLVTAQLAASLALLAAAGLMVRAQGRLSDPGVGYEPESLVVMRLELARNGYDAASAQALYDRLMERVKGLHGALSVALASSVPFQGSSIDTVSPGGTGEWQRAAIRRVSPAYFGAAGIRIIRGRGFTEDEARAPGKPAPVVISEALGRAFWSGGDPIGKRIQTQRGRELEVIGMAADTSSIQPGVQDGPLFYEPMHHLTAVDSVLVVRATGGGDALVPLIRDAVRELDPQLAPAPETIAATIDRLAERYAFILKVGSIPAVLALVLCVLGIYGMAAFAAAQRTREIGIRMALGARPADVIRLLLRSVAGPLAIGLPIGMMLAAGLGVLFQRAQLLLGTAPLDAVSYAAASVLVASTAVAATFLPARRVARIDVWRSLRVE